MVTPYSLLSRPEQHLPSEARPHKALQNHLLAALPAADFKRLLPDLEPVALPRGWIVNGAGDQAKYLYFLTAGIVAEVYTMENGASTEFAITGKEGVSGIALFLSGESTPNQAVVMSAGYAYRMKSQRLKDEFFRTGAMQRLLLRYTQALMTQIAQTSVCYRHHSVDQQLCRWLLVNLDRVPSNELVMTQELIANMLGVRRESVTAAAAKLHKAGLINYERGHISVLDRAGLEARVCECYEVVRTEFDRLLHNPAKLHENHAQSAMSEVWSASERMRYIAQHAAKSMEAVKPRVSGSS